MVNQSKAKDPRFWKKWRASGAVGTIEDAWKRNPHFETYMRKVSFVEDGTMSYESGARQLAEQHGLPLQALEAALPVGRQKEAQRKIAVYGTK